MLRSHCIQQATSSLVLLLSLSVAQAAVSPPAVPPDESEYPAPVSIGDYGEYGSEYPAPVSTGEYEYDEPFVKPEFEIYQSPASDVATGEFTWFDDHACCNDACNCCPPLLTLRAEAIIWDRVDGSSVPLVSSPVTLSSEDLDFPWRGGPRITLIRPNFLDTCWDAEAVYLGIDGWQSRADLEDIDNLLTTPTIFVGGATGTSILYTSTLDSFEFNLRRPHADWLTWLIGYRMLQVSESQITDFGGLGGHSIETVNHLYGGQGGFDALLYDSGGAFYSNLIGKAGIYGNNADTVTRTNGVGGAVPEVLADGSSTAFVGELSLLTGYRFTDRLHIVGGYNLLWVTDLALAPDQLATTNILTGVASVDADRSVFYHGASVGLQYWW